MLMAVTSTHCGMEASAPNEVSEMYSFRHGSNFKAFASFLDRKEHRAPSSNKMLAVALSTSETTLATTVFSRQTKLHNTDVCVSASAIVVVTGTVFHAT